MRPLAASHGARAPFLEERYAHPFIPTHREESSALLEISTRQGGALCSVDSVFVRFVVFLVFDVIVLEMIVLFVFLVISILARVE